MQKNLTTKTIIIVATILLCIYGIIGPGVPTSKAALMKNLKENVRLGLDLRGGSLLILQVQVQDALKAEADNVMDRLKEDVKRADIDYAGMDRNDPMRIEDADSIQINIKGVPAQKSSAFRGLVSDHYPQWILTPAGSSDYRMNLRPSELLALKSATVERAIQTISNRINNLGLTEPVVQQHGRADAEFEILVQLPGVDDPARVKEIIGTAAVLGIYEVKDGPFPSPEAAMAKHGGVRPLNTKLVKEVPRGDSPGQWYLLASTPVVTGNQLRNARAGQDEFRKWETSFTLSPDGGKRFGRYTEANIGNRLAVVLDNQVINAATIQNKIDEQGRITNLSSEQEASNLAQFLKSGSLPAGIIYRSESSVGPSLGADSIRAGLVAGMAGLAAVVIIMLAYYKRSGVNAVLALALNTVILVAALSYFGATLTLPGIAGVILTIGMPL